MAEHDDTFYVIETGLVEIAEAIDRQTAAQQSASEEISTALIAICNRLEDIGRYL